MPMGGSGGDGGASALEKQRQASLDAGTGQINQVFAKYNPDFYDARGKAYTSFATPQLMDQYRTTKNNLAYSLARNGILNSSSAVNANTALQKNLSQNQNTIANNAADQENQLRTNVQGARTNLTNQLIASGDPSVVTTQANAATAGLQAPGSFPILGNMFTDFSNTYLANMNARAYNPQTASVWSQLGFGSN